MKRARARPAVPGLTDHADVPELRMAESAGRTARDDQTHAHPGPYGNVGEVSESACAAPPSLGESRALDIGAESDRDSEALTERAGHIGVAPPGLRCREDAAIGARVAAHLEGAERSDAERGDGAVARAYRTAAALPSPRSRRGALGCPMRRAGQQASGARSAKRMPGEPPPHALGHWLLAQAYPVWSRCAWDERRGGFHERLASDRPVAGDALLRHLQTGVRGRWHDQRLPDGSFVSEPSPASSLYHIVGAARELATAG